MTLELRDERRAPKMLDRTDSDFSLRAQIENDFNNETSEHFFVKIGLVIAQFKSCQATFR